MLNVAIGQTPSPVGRIRALNTWEAYSILAENPRKRSDRLLEED